MYFYEIYVNEVKYQKTEPLTYSSSEDLKSGSIVLVPFGSKTVFGFVAVKVSKPKFPTKNVINSFGPSPLPNELTELHRWVLSYYPSGSGAIAQLFIPSALKEYPDAIVKSLNSENSLPELTKDQSLAIDTITDATSRSFLLHGETGSGKTRIYLELIKQSLADGRSAIILTPEISLISQLESIFKEQFGEIIKVLHSGLTKKSRNINWLGILNSNQPVIVIGTRSAIFAPVKKLGLVVVDEMHEPTYKQDSAPRYNALRVAAKRAAINKAKIVYGSATPLIADYYLAKNINAPIITIKSSAKPSSTIKTKIIDLKNKNEFSSHPYISDYLMKSIRERLEKNEQTLLFLNRRGTAKQVLCQKCGWQALCPRCDLPLTLHADSHIMRCHTCGYSDKPPYSCPECKGSDIKYRSLGTKALVDAIESIFPGASIQRFDTDNHANEKLSQHFDSVKSGKVDIIVGTQMLGKGLDLPKLSLVGIINADTALSMPDFSSTERSYQLIHQAVGRVGRGHINGEVVVQSFQPTNKLLEAAVDRDWNTLYEAEIKERKEFNFPPFCFMLKITVSRSSSKSAEEYIEKLYEDISKMSIKARLHEPTPSFYEKSHGKYNWQLLVKSSDRKNLVSIVNSLKKGDYTYDLDPLHLL